jgi:phosphoglycerate-specific signal transduction histidine kinase
MINKDGRISPVISLSVLSLFSIGLGVAIFVGMLYLFDNEKQDDTRDDALEQRVGRLIEVAIEQNEISIQQGEDIKLVQSAQVNLSTEARSRIVNNLEVLLPALNKTMIAIEENLERGVNNSAFNAEYINKTYNGVVEIREQLKDMGENVSQR